MSLTIGTDAYTTVAEVNAYWIARNKTDWEILATDEAEALIRLATDYIDRGWNFKGDKATGPQRLKWPRRFVYVEGFELSPTDIPWQVKEATAIMADVFRLGLYDTEGVVTTESASVMLEKVDVITVQYDTSRRLTGKAVMSHVFELLEPVAGARAQGLMRA